MIQPQATISIERLHHFQCGRCNKWWSIGDAPQRDYFCPWCGVRNLTSISKKEDCATDGMAKKYIDFFRDGYGRAGHDYNLVRRVMGVYFRALRNSDDERRKFSRYAPDVFVGMLGKSLPHVMVRRVGKTSVKHLYDFLLTPTGAQIYIDHFNVDPRETIKE